MKAFIYRGKNRLVFENIPKPSIGPDEILLKVKSVGICGTDLHIYHGGTDVKQGTIIGHEFSGEVAVVGRNVENFKVGDRAVAEHVVTCKTCYYCVRGKPNLCVKAEILGIQRPGALAEFIAIPGDLVYKIPRTINFEEGALIEPLTIALFAASRAGFLLEKTVAVVGQGPIGILLDQVLATAGAHVIGIDVLPHRLAFVQKKGWAGATLDARSKDFTKAFRALSPMGVDAAFEAVGKDATANLCLEIARRDGDVHLLGVFEKPSTLDLMKLIKKELNVFGSWTCSFSFPDAIDLVARKKIELTPLVTHRYRFDDAVRAFKEADAYSDNRIKTVINF